MKKTKLTREKKILLVYLMVYLVAALTIALHQPLNDTYPLLQNPPDEHSRFKVPLYICNHGVLPTGYEEELFSGNCKWTYGFYTLLPYMVQGYAMRFVNLFTDSSLALLYTARIMNVLNGLLMAYVVALIGKKLFRDERVKWLFCFLVTFLPQSLFLHTYSNPDSMCLLSTALMIYGLLRGYGDSFSVKSCAFLTSGVILCALSYYNAYGFILSSIALFTAYFLTKENGRWRFDWKPFLKKGLLISGVVLLCISWSFIRNYILYDGDIIGLTAMQNLIKSYGIPRETFYSRGESLLTMLTGTDFFLRLCVSFIACYGSVTLYTWKPIYAAYILLLGTGLLGMLFCKNRDIVYAGSSLQTERKWQRIFFHINMIFCIAIPIILLIRYAYTVDYQAQGRYIMPGLIPLMYYVTRGLEKFPLWRKCPEKYKTILATLVLVGIVLALLITVFVFALPRYLEVSVL